MDVEICLFPIDARFMKNISKQSEKRKYENEEQTIQQQQNNTI